MKTLHLNLKKEWFDLILSGEKKEEYREIKNSMISKFINWQRSGCTRDYFTATLQKDCDINAFESRIKEYDTVTFSNGMTPPVPRFEIEFKGIEIKEGRPEWGAEKGKKYFVIKLGEILNQENIKP